MTVERNNKIGQLVDGEWIRLVKHIDTYRILSKYEFIYHSNSAIKINGNIIILMDWNGVVESATNHSHFDYIEIKNGKIFRVLNTKEIFRIVKVEKL